ncbi:Outer membrane immunogenic protein [Pseudomonas sp. 8AS]|uniref:outer membrane protein n=1 Tax=Pseudomonas sp. 8AS TaxID=2653163 RepID=UPI0012EEF18B|nr:outer membrane beta-barrel protein [Pseudomonas sp. 8AS]VXC49699.1 Outer membrane immunogenic protein [Pseudomonas sp. 8AS]
MRHSYLVALSLLGAANLLPALAYADSSSARDWSGAYFGASLGAAEGKGDTSTHASVGGTSDYFTTTDPQQLGNAGDGSVSQWNASGGLFGGYGWQQGNLYWGVEASLNSLSFDESHNPATQTYLSDPASTFTLNQSVEADWQGTLRARLGLAEGRWLAYLTGGIALSRLKVESNYADTSGLGGSGHGSSEESKTGWVVGAGGEYALSERLSLRGEYLYADYGSVDTSYAVTNPTFAGLSSTIKDKVDFKTQTLSLGLAYHF